VYIANLLDKWSIQPIRTGYLSTTYSVIYVIYAELSKMLRVYKGAKQKIRD
jgi:hypothetical protein